MPRPSKVAKWIGMAAITVVAASWFLSATRYLNVRNPFGGMFVLGSGYVAWFDETQSAGFGTGYVEQTGDPWAWLKEAPYFHPAPGCFGVAHWFLLAVLGAATILCTIRVHWLHKIAKLTPLQIRIARWPFIRRVTKWVGAFTCAVLVGLLAVSYLFYITVNTTNYSRALVFPGYVQVGIFQSFQFRSPDANAVTYRWIKYGPTGNIRAAHWQRVGFFLPSPKIYPFRPPNTHLAINIPFWLPLVVVGLPTILLFWRDRRPPPGHCRLCRYDLTGNTSGICPECGIRIAQEGNLPVKAPTVEPPSRCETCFNDLSINTAGNCSKCGTAFSTEKLGKT